MDKRISKFIAKHHVMTIATSVDDNPWVCHAFYAIANDGALIFTSSDSTRHIEMALKNPQVSVSIVLESKIIGRLQGVQIEGELTGEANGDKQQYIKRFPYAAAMLEKVWRIEITTAKFTDNTLGFGTKLHYDKNAQ